MIVNFPKEHAQRLPEPSYLLPEIGRIEKEKSREMCARLHRAHRELGVVIDDMRELLTLVRQANKYTANGTDKENVEKVKIFFETKYKPKSIYYENPN